MTLMDLGVVGREERSPGSRKAGGAPMATVKGRHIDIDELRADRRQSDMVLMTMIMVLMEMVIGLLTVYTTSGHVSSSSCFLLCLNLTSTP